MGLGDRVRITDRCNIPDARGKLGKIYGYIGQQGNDYLFQVELDEGDFWGTRRLVSCFESELEKVEGDGATPSGPCECGAERCGLPIHSSWCPRYVKP